MPSLEPCAACHRHVRRGDAVCPFCGAQRFEPAPARTAHAGAWLGLLLGAAGMLVGCAPAAQKKVYGGPRPLGEPPVAAEDSSIRFKMYSTCGEALELYVVEENATEIPPDARRIVMEPNSDQEVTIP